jgi:hypothetical protein
LRGDTPPFLKSGKPTRSLFILHIIHN